MLKRFFCIVSGTFVLALFSAFAQEQEYYAPTQNESAQARGCTLHPVVYSVTEAGDLSSIMTGFLKSGTYVSFLLPGRNYFLGSDLMVPFNNLSFSLCGLDHERFPRLFFSEKGFIDGDCIAAEPHSLWFNTTGLRVERVHLVFPLPQEVDGLTHITHGSACSSDLCEKTYGFILKQSAVSVLALKNASSSAITLVNAGQAEDNLIYQFDTVYIEHLAGQGAAIRQARSHMKYKNINMDISGGGIGLRRGAYPGSRDGWDYIFYLLQAAATGVAVDGDRPVWMRFEVPTYSTLGEVCLSGTWKPDDALELADLFEGEKPLNQVCGDGDSELYWLSQDSGTPYNASRMNCPKPQSNPRPLVYLNASQCQYSPFVYDTRNHSAERFESDFGSGLGPGDEQGLPYCENVTVSSVSKSQSIPVLGGSGHSEPTQVPTSPLDEDDNALRIPVIIAAGSVSTVVIAVLTGVVITYFILKRKMGSMSMEGGDRTNLELVDSNK